MGDALHTVACRVSDAGRSVAASTGASALGRLATVERMLAVLCMSIPAWLILFDDRTGIRSSISAYYDMDKAQAFYFPLTVASMLFFFNGVIKSRRGYNIVLGVLAAGVVLVSHNGPLDWLHIVAAVGFFGLNALVILWFSRDVDRWLRQTLLAVAAVTLVAFLAKWISTFWAEWISLALVSIHFLFDSIGFRGYSTRPDRSTTSGT